MITDKLVRKLRTIDEKYKNAFTQQVRSTEEVREIARRGGVVDRLRQIKRNAPERFRNLEIYPVKFGQRIKSRYFHDSTTYMMSVVKKLLQPYDENGAKKPVELILPDDEDLRAQLSTRKYALTESSKIRIESKEALKKRGRPSPDEADCVLLLCLPVKPPKKRSERFE